MIVRITPKNKNSIIEFTSYVNESNECTVQTLWESGNFTFDVESIDELNIQNDQWNVPIHLLHCGEHELFNPTKIDTNDLNDEWDCDETEYYITGELIVTID